MLHLNCTALSQSASSNSFMYIIIVSSAIVGKVNAVSIVNKKNTQHKLNYLTVFLLFVCATEILFQDPRERGKNSWSSHHLIGLPAYKSDPANLPNNPSEAPIKRRKEFLSLLFSWFSLIVTSALRVLLRKITLRVVSVQPLEA